MAFFGLSAIFNRYPQTDRSTAAYYARAIATYRRAGVQAATGRVVSHEAPQQVPLPDTQCIEPQGGAGSH